MTKRIAFCLSGQPRTWEKCYASWFKVFESWGDIDVFFHLWDYNSHSSLAAEFDRATGEPKESVVSEDEKARIISTLNPKRFAFQPKKKDIVSRAGGVKNVVAAFSHSQFYSLWKSAVLKRQYEIENDFEYDVVIKLRADLIFQSNFTNAQSISIDSVKAGLKPQTIYSIHNEYNSEFNHLRIGDIFFISDSLTFDHIAMFYDGLGYIEADAAFQCGELMYPPECALYYYCASTGINNSTLPHIDFKIMRDAEHVKRAGKLEPYETA